MCTNQILHTLELERVRASNVRPEASCSAVEVRVAEHLSTTDVEDWLKGDAQWPEALATRDSRTQELEAFNTRSMGDGNAALEVLKRVLENSREGLPDPISAPLKEEQLRVLADTNLPAKALAGAESYTRIAKGLEKGACADCVIPTVTTPKVLLVALVDGIRRTQCVESRGVALVSGISILLLDLWYSG